MPTAAKLEAVRRLVASAPDAALDSLHAALAHAPDLSEVWGVVEQERRVRSLFAQAFGPILPMTAARADGLPAPRLSLALIRDLWRAMRADHPAQMRAALDRLEEWDPRYDEPLAVFDELALTAARLLEAREEAVGDRELALYLRLIPMGRQALARIGDWVGKATEERAAVLRLIFQDAVGVTPDAAPRLIEMLFAVLPEPWLILRPIALITERAGDRYLAASEMSVFGERLLDRVDASLDALRTLDLAGGARAAHAAAAEVTLANIILAEFEHSVELSREGPWGARIAAARGAVVAVMETRLRETPRVVEQALPMHVVRLTGRMTRPAPDLARAPDPRHVEPARALMVLLGETRHASASGGFGALRAQVAEALSPWLEVYADELIDLINTGDAPDQGVAHAYLALAADFLEASDNEKAAKIVRRRAAVAGVGAPSQDVA